MKYQVTVFDPSNKHKPISVVVEADDKSQAKNKGLLKICALRLWHMKDLTREGYTSAKIREYDKEKIERDNNWKYAMIKHEKYKSGEWNKPKRS